MTGRLTLNAILRGLAFGAFIAALIGAFPACDAAAPRPEAALSLIERRPETASMLSGAAARPPERDGRGFRLATPSPLKRAEEFRPVSSGVVARLPEKASGAISLRSGRGDEVRVRRRGGLPSPARMERGAVTYESAGEGVDAVLLTLPNAIEELLILREPGARLGYDIDLAAGWSLKSSGGGVVEMVNPAGIPRMRMVADRAWDSAGAEVPISIRVDAAGIELSLDPGAALPAIIDPAWSEAASPVKQRGGHSATLLADGRVLIAGGSSSLFAEIYDPKTGAFTLTGALNEPRESHTATLLPSGHVLIAGGSASPTAELYDPKTGTFTLTGPMSEPREGHTATLLPSGRVLLVKSTAEIYDPAIGAFVPTGPLVTPKLYHTATLLPDGRVVIIGTENVEIFDPEADAGAGAFTFAEPTPPNWYVSDNSATLLRTGKVLIAGGCPCWADSNGYYASTDVYLYDPETSDFTPTGSIPTFKGLVDHTAVLLPSGEVLLAGGTLDPQGAFIYNPATETFTGAPGFGVGHEAPTATLLPSGEVLFVGGIQGAATLFVSRGGDTAGGFSISGSGLGPTVNAAAARLLDGRVLITGFGAELYDPVTDTSTVAPPMVVDHALHTATTLVDGRVLIAGGPGNVAEIFDPTANGGAGSFTKTADMLAPRSGHSAILLPSGQVFVAGGAPTAELYNPSTGAWSALPPMTLSGDLSAALLDNGNVLVVSETAAEIFDPQAGTFTPTAPPFASRKRPTITPLPGGKAFVFGNTYTLVGEIYDAVSSTWSFTDYAPFSRFEHKAVLLPSGNVLVVGGTDEVTTLQLIASGDAKLFSLRGAGGDGSFTPLSYGGARQRHIATLLLDGRVLVAGGTNCEGFCGLPNDPPPGGDLFSETVGDEAWRPVLTSAPAKVVPGQAVLIKGSGFIGLEGTAGNTKNSSSVAPSVVWEALAGGGMVPGTLTDWTDTTAVWTVPSTAYYGLGWLRVITSGIVSTTAVPVEIAPAPLAVACSFDAQCESGFCSDGVCCDKQCGDPCEGCSAARKGEGADGACGPVPPERFSDDACVLSKGAPCTSAGQCQSGFCSDGVCCDSACGAQCEACDSPGSVGLCVPITGAPRGERPPCEAASDPCDSPICDGKERASCAAIVGPCEPYACGASACVTVCEDEAGCAPGYRCDAPSGQCFPGACDGSIAITPDGAEINCSPFRCEADGSCRTSCGKITDCDEGYICDPEGRCVGRPQIETVGGCGCAAPGHPGRLPLEMVAVALAALLFLTRFSAARCDQ